MSLLVTVFTPTFNRGDLLCKLYESLAQQTVFDFEWVIVDDGSQDMTQNYVQQLSSGQPPFSIRYIRQKHGGKHRAINTGVKAAKGEWFFIVDSDDLLLPNAIELVSKWVQGIEGRLDIAGVAGLCVRPDGAIIGDAPAIPKGSFVDASNLERHKMNLMGDKAEVYKTEILVHYPFPEIEGETFVTERYCWDAIAADGYSVRWYNVPIYLRDYLEGGLSKSGANSLRGHIDNFGGYCLFVRQSLEIWEPTEGVTLFREYNDVANYIGLSWHERARCIGHSRVWYLFALASMPVLYAKRISKRALMRFNG